MTAAAGSPLELIQYLDRVNSEDPKDVAQAIRYVKDSILMLAQSGELPNDQVPMSTLYDTVDRFVDMIAKSYEKQGEKVDQLESMKIKVEELKSSLLVGQVASKLEQEIVKLLLKDTGLDCIITLNQLSLAVNSNPDRMSRTCLDANSSQVVKINENWDNFEKNFKQAKILYRAINVSKYRRNDDAHPNMTLSEASERLRRADLKDRKSVNLMLTTLDSMKVDHIGTRVHGSTKLQA